MAASLPPPVDTIDWNNMVNLKVHEVNGHIESTYSSTTGQWTAPRFVRSPYIRIHGLSPGLNYGQQALEGFKAFRMPPDGSNNSHEAIALFRPDRNAVRMNHSAITLSMPPIPQDLFITACRSAAALNAEFVPPHASGGSMYLRPLMYSTDARLGLTSKTGEFAFTVFGVPTGVNDGTRAPRALILDEFDRTAPRGTGHAKVGGNYAPVLKWSDGAKGEGYGLTLHLDSKRQEEVDEFSTCGFLGVKGRGEEGVQEKTAVVVPDSPCILDSVTSNSVQQLARSLGWEVEKRAVRYTELVEFDEVLGAGTSVSLVPVKSITRKRGPGKLSLPEGESGRVRVQIGKDGTETETVTYLADDDDGQGETGGPVYRKLLAKLRGIQFGKLPDEFGWRLEVGPEDLHVEMADH